MIVIPKLDSVDDERKPGWLPIVSRDDAPLKPIVRCGGCGRLAGLGAHSVALDGTVTASFLDVAPDGTGCGWHEWIVLDRYDGPAFGPGEGR
jgi:hypothetical protein